MADDDRERWNERYRTAEAGHPPSPFLLGLDALLPREGAALDVAGGAGAEAVWLARRGLVTTLVDVSDVALAKAQDAAANAGVPLTTLTLDLEAQPLPQGPFDVIVCLHYLQRSLFDEVPRRLAPGGLFVFAQATKKNLERNARPSARFLLDEGELATLVRGLEVVSLTEGWTDAGRHEARLVARRARVSPGRS